MPTSLEPFWIFAVLRLSNIGFLKPAVAAKLCKKGVKDQDITPKSKVSSSIVLHCTDRGNVLICIRYRYDIKDKKYKILQSGTYLVIGRCRFEVVLCFQHHYLHTGKEQAPDNSDILSSAFFTLYCSKGLVQASKSNLSWIQHILIPCTLINSMLTKLEKFCHLLLGLFQFFLEMLQLLQAQCVHVLQVMLWCQSLGWPCRCGHQYHPTFLHDDEYSDTDTVLLLTCAKFTSFLAHIWMAN